LIISSAHRIEHYGIALYGALRQFAGVLGYDKEVALLDATVHEKRRADYRLTNIAERINPTAKRLCSAANREEGL
jgi:ferritin-like metal-binding protein YciE